MNNTYTEEQVLLQNSVQRWLQDHYSVTLRQQGSQSEIGHLPDVWQALVVELGLGALCLPERLGGLGFDAAHYQLLMENVGRSLVAEPLLESLLMAGEMLARVDGDVSDSLLQALAEGNLCPLLAWVDGAQPVTAQQTAQGWCLNGCKTMVMAAPWADGFIVSARTQAGEPGLFWLAATRPGLTRHDVPTIDGRRAADLLLTDVHLPVEALLATGGTAQRLLEQVLVMAGLGVCAEGVGVVSQLLDDTVAYSKTRQQFGQPLARFQALQHRMVDMFLAREMAAAATSQLVRVINAAQASGDWRDTELALASAKLAVAEACTMVGENAVQLHGGMGMTAELPVSHYFRRATVISRYLGTPDQMRRRIAALTYPPMAAAAG